MSVFTSCIMHAFSSRQSRFLSATNLKPMTDSTWSHLAAILKLLATSCGIVMPRHCQCLYFYKLSTLHDVFLNLFLILWFQYWKVYKMSSLFLMFVTWPTPSLSSWMFKPSNGRRGPHGLKPKFHCLHFEISWLLTSVVDSSWMNEFSNLCKNELKFYC